MPEITQKARKFESECLLKVYSTPAAIFQPFLDIALAFSNTRLNLSL